MGWFDIKCFYFHWFKMTLPNFDWTDKKSVRWFIMLPTGHEGPYSLATLEDRCSKKKLALSVSIWSEGLTNPISLQEVLDRDSMPPLPPLPNEDLPPEIPFQNLDEDLPQVPQRKLSPMIMLSLAAIGLMI